MKSFLLFLFVASATAIPASVRAIDITVTSAADSGTGSLREALGSVSIDDEIVFAPELDGATIRLTSGELFVLQRIKIDASDLPSGITISGESTFRVFNIQAAGVVFDSLTIANGKAPDATPTSGATGGGGIFVSGSAHLTLRRCTVRDNRAGNGFPDPSFVSGAGGGGISCIGTLVVNGSTFHSNSAGDGITTGMSIGRGGAGGAIFHFSSGSLTIRNSTFADNKTGDGIGSQGFGGNGGAIYSNATTTLLNSTITNNSSGSGGSGDPVENGFGGGIYLAVSGGTANMTNTIIAGNSAGPTGSPPGISSDIFLAATIVNTSGVNLIGIGDGGSGSFPAPVSPGDPNANDDLVGTVANPRQANLGLLTNNGGPTLTVLPLPGSPAIDPVGGDSISTLPLDQRGLNRFVPDFVDIGAVEFNPADQARLDAEAAAAAAAQAAANAVAAQRSSLQAKIKKLQKKQKSAAKKGKVAKAKRLKKKIKKLKKQLSDL